MDTGVRLYDIVRLFFQQRVQFCKHRKGKSYELFTSVTCTGLDRPL